MQQRQFYLTACVVGTLLPWIFFAQFFATQGLAPVAFFLGLFANGAAAGFSTDVLVSICVFWVWAYFDARERRITTWWLIFPAGCLVGLSLALPLYLYLRAGPARQVAR